MSLDQPHHNYEPQPREQVVADNTVVPLACPALLHQAPPDGTEAAMLLPSLSRRQALADAAIFLLLFVPIFMAGGVLAGAMGHAVDPDNPERAAYRFVGLMMFVRAAGAVLIVRALLKRRGLSWASIGMTVEKPIRNVLAGLAALAVIGVLNQSIGLLLFIFAPSVLEQMSQNVKQLQQMLPDINVWSAALVFVMVGFYEELVFRGFLLTRLRRATGGWVWAFLLTAILFVPPHLLEQRPIAMVPITVLALVLTVVTIWRRSLLPAMVAHFLFDFLTMLYVMSIEIPPAGT